MPAYPKPISPCSDALRCQRQDDPIAANDQATKNATDRQSLLPFSALRRRSHSRPPMIADVREPAGCLHSAAPPTPLALTHPRRERIAMSKMGHVYPARITKASSPSISLTTAVNRNQTWSVGAAGVASAPGLEALDAPDGRMPIPKT